MNQSDGIDDPADWLSAMEAATLLGVKRETLYAYVSRGHVRSRAGAGRRRLYHRDDLLRLRARRRARSGHGAVAAGALRWGEPVLQSSITEIADDGPRYRGHRLTALLEEGHPFEDIAELLWSGALPHGAPSWPRAPRVPALRLPEDATPIERMHAAVVLAAPRERDRHLTTAEASLRIARDLTQLVAAAAGPNRSNASGARGLLASLGGRTGARAEHAVERARIVCADHELNPSSFAARVTASVGADLYACVATALATLSGPAHGGMSERVVALVEEIGRPEDAARVLRDRLRRGDDLPGFGHRLYPRSGDPRAAPLIEEARRVAPRARGVRVLSALVDAMDLAGGPAPTLDLGLAALALALRLGPGGGGAVFASGRVAGWIAHALEQREAGFVLRPRARYAG